MRVLSRVAAGLAAAVFATCTACGGADKSGTEPAGPLVLTAPEFYDVFEGGEGGYDTYRIPAVIRTQAGTVLAFAEGRVGSAADRAENDIVLRRSTDAGVTWGDMQIVAEAGVQSLNDPTPVELRDGPHAGRILLMFRRIACRMAKLGGDCVPVGTLADGMLLAHSDDDGRTWSTPVEISKQLRHADDGPGPGIAIVKQLAPAAGRIVYPLHHEGALYVLTSDDGGDTWAAGAEAPFGETTLGGDEVQVVELSDGRLMLNARDLDGVPARKSSVSTDGGATWSPLRNEPALVDSQVMASILAFSGLGDGERPRLLFSNPADAAARWKGTIRLSYDDGQTWPVSKLLYKDLFGYSVLVRLDCRNVGLLFEEGLFSRKLVFARFPLGWLTDGKDAGDCR